MKEMPVVDDAERELIRGALKRYKQQHGRIGNPELHQRMLYALFGDEASAHESALSLSTLQRFLRGAHRTDDRVVLRYRRFLERAAPPEGAEEFAKEFLKYFAPALTLAPPASPDQFSRIYKVRQKAFPEPGAKRGKIVLYEDGTEYASGGVLFLKPNLKTDSFTVEEKVVVDARPGLGIEGRIEPNTHGGVFIPLSTVSVLICIRTYLTARLYVLQRDSAEPDVLTGSLFGFDAAPQAVMVTASPGPAVSAGEVRLEPVLDESSLLKTS